MLFTNALILISGAMLGPIYALYIEDIGGDLLDASAAGAIFALVAGLTVLVMGRVTDQIKEPELIIVAGYSITGAGFLLLSFVTNVWELLAVQALMGLGEAIAMPAYDAVFSRHLDNGQEGREWGSWEATAYFSTTFGAIVGGVIATYLGFDILFVIMALLCVSSALYIYFLPRSVL